MLKPGFKAFYLLLIACTAGYSQQSILVSHVITNDNAVQPTVVRIPANTKHTVNDVSMDNSALEINSELREMSKVIFTPPRQNTDPAHLVVSSFNNNIHFGGFWDKYAIINFTPNMSIRPADFISIYAVHNTSILVPIKEVTSYTKSIVLQGAAVMAIDNSIKYLLHPYPIMQSIVGFVLKNAAMMLIHSHTTEGKLAEFKTYYYSVNVRF